MAEQRLSTAQIGRCGELLVQYQLLLKGIESAPLTTDAGIDLVAYARPIQAPLSIQVKTNLRAKPSGGKGRLGLDWWIPDDCPAQLVMVVSLNRMKIWAFTMDEVRALAQQHPEGRHHLYMYVDYPKAAKSGTTAIWESEFLPYLLDNRLEELFGRVPVSGSG